MNLAASVKLLRPTQWLKNLMLFFPPFLGGAILNPGIAQKGALPFLSFCLASSSTYVVNDLLDRHNDARHDKKRHRPIPSGAVSVPQAWWIAAVSLAASLFLAAFVSPVFLLLTLSYLAVSSAYSLRLKELALIDLFCIAAGFLLRLQAGGEAFGIVVSEWLFLSVFLLAMFLATGKRLSEKILLGGTAGEHRKALLDYPEGYLEGVMYLCGGSVLVTYTMYVISRHMFVYTVPLCCFGLLRYILRVKHGGGGDPTESLLKDRPLFVVGLLWAVMIGYSLYGGR
ncbi:decaprenyl-phosphate phosphoribosyltransferase [Geomesophilobacter sediminis]|uniref:Decaprenyl-phosphate phosphoribosyltransferase n=1 Tax=Geomesophilobacter sediminis TaxID=2798584 RepID=A0A8J7LY11_9BACT|nr:decaprenyl-phosphate phosphoribosyltransferase [Geomesophilobacter sediminis]MBJ6724081.1 decaprenyl-phosphate phosphoribosyltransferase [Geomesophilobacter sediminis]